jgi:hypothetical protein
VAQTHALDAIESFLELERRFVQFCSAVTFIPAHSKVHSPTLAGLLLDCGSLSESIFKSAMDNTRYDTTANIAVIRAKRYAITSPYYNINDSRSVFRPDQFYAKKVWYIPRSDSSFPWHAWQQNTKNPSWRKSYNNVKHDRFGNISQAKLGTVMHAMQATFLSLVQTLDFREDLIKLGIIRSPTLDVAELLASATHWEPLPTNEVVFAKSQVFGYKYKSTGSPRNANDISVFL